MATVTMAAGSSDVEKRLFADILEELENEGRSAEQTDVASKASVASQLRFCKVIA